MPDVEVGVGDYVVSLHDPHFCARGTVPEGDYSGFAFVIPKCCRRRPCNSKKNKCNPSDDVLHLFFHPLKRPESKLSSVLRYEKIRAAILATLIFLVVAEGGGFEPPVR